MDAPTPPPIPSMPATPFTVAEDIPCRRCGYNLRGLQTDGKCPECGAEVVLSVLGDRLRYSDPAWVAKVGQGCRLIIFGLAVSILAGCLVAGVTRFVTGGNPILAQLTGLGAGLIGFFGNWLLTTPEPTHIGEDKLVTARRVARIGTLIGASQGVLQLAIYSSISGVSSILLATIGGVAIGAATVAGEFAKYYYVEKLAVRIPDPKLARTARWVRWLMTIGTSLALIAGLVTALYVSRFMRTAMAAMPTSGPSGLVVTTAPSGGPGFVIRTTSQPNPLISSTSGPAFPASAPTATAFSSTATGSMAVGFMAMGCFAIIFGLAYLIVHLLAISVIWRLGRALKTEAASAQTHWAGPAPPS